MYYYNDKAVAKAYLRSRKIRSEHDPVTPFRSMFLNVAAEKGIQSVLDMGCGSGDDVAFFRQNGLAAYGVDPSPHFVVHAKETYGDFFALGDLQSYQPPKPFDAIWCIAVLLHCPRENLRQNIEVLFNMTKDGNGHVFISVKRGYGEDMDHRLGVPRKMVFYTPQEITDASQDLGKTARIYAAEDMTANQPWFHAHIS